MTGDTVHLFPEPDASFVGVVTKRSVMTTMIDDDMGQQRFHRVQYEVTPCP